MSKKSIIAIVTIVLVVSGASAATWAVQSKVEGLGHVFGNHPIKRLIMGKIGRMLVLHSELNIEPEQKDKLFQILKSRKSELIPMARDIAAKRHALRDAVLAEPAKEAQIRAAARNLTKAVEDAAVKASKLVAEARPILTEKQRKLIREYIKDHDRAANDWLDEMAK
ncbi:Spy/CpxP family protein refolding chaperone [Thermodesulfobacteriota bacterium]